MNLFTPAEENKIKHLLSSIDYAETQICIEANQQKGRHNWGRSQDARKRVREVLKSVRKQADSMLRLMDRSDAERMKV